jgi:hypothetical protein
MKLETNDNGHKDDEFLKLYRQSIALSQHLPVFSCLILKRKFRIPFGTAQRLLAKLKDEGYPVIDQESLISNPNIKIVLINNSGTKSIAELIEKAHPNIEVIHFVS